jgi:FHA domain-containing protein
LRLDGDTVSRIHCRLTYEDGELLIEDLGSANGTYVNRVRVVGRLTVEPSDAINLGAYSLRARALHASGSIRSSSITETEAITRVEAVLSAGPDFDSEEALVDIASGVDQRLYEDAIRRATGTEPPARISTTPDSEGKVASAMFQSDRSTSETDFSDERRSPPIRGETRQPPGPAPSKHISNDEPLPLSAVPVKPPSESVRLDPDVEARLRDLDELIAALDARQKEARGDSRRGLRAIEGMLGRTPAPGKDPLSTSSRIEREMLEGLRAMSTQELSRSMGSKLAVEGRVMRSQRLVPVPQKVAPPPPLPRLATVPRAPIEDSRVETADTAKESSASKKTDRIVEVDQVEPIDEESGPFEDVWTKSSAVHHSRVGPPPLPPAESLDKPTVPDRGPPTLSDEPMAEGRPKAMPPPLPVTTAPPPLPRLESMRSLRSLHYSPPPKDNSSLATERNPTYFEGVEIAARARGKLVDVSILKKEGDQYVLGHVTPQGRIAPSSAHGGLRMLRINPDRTVDLVFPRDVAGHLVRGKETVMFGELTEGRKYSCLRLEVHDIATVILGEGQRAISYHIRFLLKGSKPSPAARGLAGVTSS